MLILGSTSDISKAFVNLAITKDSLKKLHFATSNVESTKSFAQHVKIKYGVDFQIHELDLKEKPEFSFIDSIDFETAFCAIGYLGLDTEKGLYNKENTQRIIQINYANLVLVLNRIAQKLEKKGKGNMIILSSVAGERGKQSNFIYGSAKAGITSYASGLRNYLSKKGVHVLTVKPGFMATKMTRDINLPKFLTASPEQAARLIYKAYKKKKNISYVLWVWRYIMLIIKNIPEFMFKKMKL